MSIERKDHTATQGELSIPAPRSGRLGRLILAQDDLSDPNSPRIIRASTFDIDSVPEPTELGSFDANITIPDTDKTSQLHRHITGAIYAGAKLGNDGAKTWGRLSPSYRPEDSMLMVTGNFGESGSDDNRRLSLRLMPKSWQNPAFQTPYTLHEVEGELQLHYNRDDETVTVGSFDELLPIDGIADVYIRGGREAGDNGVVMNPIMTCPHRCHFCSRQYDSLNRGGVDQPFPLMVFNPKEMIEHAQRRLPDLDWKSVNRVSLVTGSFNTFEDMTDYIHGLRDELKAVSGGHFRPDVVPEQEILVLTHLARTPEHFKKLRELGVSLQDTIEIIDDAVRKDVMPPAHAKAVPKFHYPFEEIVDSVPEAIDILGDENYRATVILGLDEFDVTMNGLRSLRANGLSRLYSPVFQPYGYNDHRLYRMSYEEVVKARDEAITSFQKVY